MDSQGVQSSEPKSDSKSSREGGIKRLFRKKQSKDVSEDIESESGDFLLIIFQLIINDYHLNHHFIQYMSVQQVFKYGYCM